MSGVALPKILAGPAIRRAHAQEIVIWCASSVPIASVVVCLSDAVSDDPIGCDVEVNSHSLGVSLHVTLVILRPNVGAFPARRAIAYDLILNGETLADLGLLGDGGIAYPGRTLPGIMLPDANMAPPPFLHGSCRRPHAPGFDGMTKGDRAVGEAYADPDRRPSVLFLTGDQIYADDVSPNLFPKVQQLGQVLTGLDEQLPGIADPVSRLVGKVRANTVSKAARFTTGAPDNHLLSFGEFAAMYLLAWNPELWSGLDFATSTPLGKARTGAASARRLMANTPTYMAFDDHEITDDWNIHKDWESQVYGKPVGRRVVANGLAAFWAFQGWGNDPDMFDAGFVSAITAHLAQPSPATGEVFDNALRHFGSSGENAAGWSYGAPTHPPAMVLDTRTRRAGSGNRAPALMDDSALACLPAIAGKAGARADRLLVVVSPYPVLGQNRLEWLQKIGSDIVRPAVLDKEAWYANRAAYGKCLRTLAVLPARALLILSGDIHFGYSACGTLSGANGDKRFLQVVASPFKNEALGSIKRVLRTPPVSGDETETVWVWDTLPTSPVLNRLYRDRALSAKENPVLERQIAIIEGLLADAPTVLSEHEAALLGVAANADHVLVRRYAPLNPPQGGDPVVVFTNHIGLVSVGDASVTHTHLLASGGTGSTTTEMLPLE